MSNRTTKKKIKKEKITFNEVLFFPSIIMLDVSLNLKRKKNASEMKKSE
jgi:hypothetical protein